MIESPKSKRTSRVSKYKGAEEESATKIINIVPMNDNQKLYIDALKTKRQVIVLGPSGTGKTYVAATIAANMYAKKQISKIIITRPAVSVGKSLGALHLAKKYAIDASIIEFGLDDVVRSEICKQWLTAFYEEGL